MIEHFRRQSDGEWVLSTLEGLAAALKIESIGCSLKLSDIFDGVQFLPLDVSTERRSPTLVRKNEKILAVIRKT